MKRVFLSLMLLAFGLSAMAQQIQLRSADKAECVKSDMTGLRASFSFSTIEAEDVESERGTFSWLSMPNTVIGGNEGDPQIPVINQLIAVPFGANPWIEIKNYSSTDYRLEDLGIKTLVPRQPSVRKDKRPEDVPFVMNEAAYQTRGLRSEPTATVSVDGTMRGIQLGTMTIEPVSYDPVNNTLRVFNDIEVEVHFDGADAQATEDMLLRTYSPAFDNVYAQLFNNRAITDVYTDHPDLYNTPVKMLVICYSGFQGNAALESWLQWKLQKGYYVDIYYTSETGTSATNIKNFIKTKYNASVSAGNAYTYLVVIGDTGQVPQYMTKTVDESCASDLGYAAVNFTTSSTSNYFPDMYYSRMSVENATHLTNYINKVLTYEKYEFTDGGNYLNNVILVGGWDSNWTARVAKPTINYATNYYFKSSNTTYGGFENGTISATVSTSSTQGYSGTNNGCYNGINNGVCFLNYTAHGDKQEWYQPKMTAAHVATLTNTGKYFFGVGNCCLTGNFNNTSTDYSPGSAIGTNACFAETMIRVPNAGAVAYVGCSPYSYWYEDFYWAVGAHSYSAGNYPTQSASSKGVYDIMFEDQYWNSASSLLYLGNLAVQQAVTNGNTNSGVTDGNCNNSAHYYFQFYHTFGDGSVMPYITKPEVNTVTIPSTVTPGTTSITVNALAGSYVAVTDNSSVIYGVAEANSSGVATVNFTNAIPGSGTLYVVVTRQQYQPYFGTISIVGGTQYTITATANPSNAGTVTGGGELYENTTCTLTAIPNSGFDFVNWDDGNTENPRSFTVTGPATFVANFAPLTLHNITLASVTNGTISADHTTAYKNDVVNLTATPASGYNLNNWVVFKTGDINTTIAVNGNSFVMPDFDVTVAATFVSSQSNEITIGSTAVNTTGWALPTHVYYSYSLTQQIYTSAEVGSAGTITAISFYYLGSSTSGSASSSGSRNFNIYMSNTSNSSLSNNWVNETSDHLVYSGTCTFNSVGWYTFTLDTPFEYDGNSNLLLTFDDNTGSYTVSARMYFRTYSTNENRARYIDSDTNDFDPSSATSLTTSSGSYNSTATDNNIIKLAKVTAGTNAALSVSPSSLSGFNSVGGVSPSESQGVSVVAANMQGNLNVTLPAGFEASTTATGTYASTLTLTPTNGELRTMVYVRLSANANPGSITGNMTFTCGSTTATVSLSGNSIPSGATQYTITANASPAAGGTVSGAGTYYEGLTCTLTATANAGFEFQNWSDGNTENPRSFTVTGNATYTAVFAEIPVYEISVSEVSNGSISADKTSAMVGETVTLTANPSNGYALDSWHVFETENVSNIVTVTGDSFTMPEFDVTVTASFVANPQYVKVTSALSDWSGEYLIVYEGGSVAFNGGLTTLDATGNTISVTINDNAIACNATTQAAQFTIAKSGNSYTIKSASGYYIGRTSNSNGLQSSLTQAYTNTITYNNGDVDVKGSGGAYLRYNSATSDRRFRYYKSSTYTQQKAIQLYKKVNPETVTYTITFNANGGSGNMVPQVVNELEPTMLVVNVFTRDGYDFVGWNTAADGSGDHYADQASVALSDNLTLYAQWSEPVTVNYQLVTTTDELQAGRHYLIVNVDNSKALGTTQNNNNRSAEEVTIANNVINTIDNTICELTLGGTTGAWTFFDANWGDNGGYLYAASSSKNYLRTQEENDANGQWSIEINSEGVATITAQGTNSHNLMRYNSTNNLFSCYASGQQDVYLFAEIETVELTQGSNWWTPTTTMTLEQLEEALGSNAVLINSQDDGFARYENNAWSGTLTEIVPGQMYKIETTAPVSLIMSGAPATGVSLTLMPGHNWFGYTGPQAADIATALGCLGITPTNGDTITDQNGNVSTYNGTTWTGGVVTLQPGHGYVYQRQQ